MERLQKVLAHAGICSRRKAEELILQGQVEVNDQVVTRLGTKVEPEKDKISVSGKPVDLEKKIYIAINKPKGYISTVSDTHNRLTVLDLVPRDQRLYPVGRLDKDTTGLLIMTNDGDLAHRLSHPKFEVEKTYEAVIKGELSRKDIERLQKGIYLEGRRTAPSKVKILFSQRNRTCLRIAIREGRKRQVRLMLLYVKHPVVELKRVKFGNLSLGNLKPGQWRYLKKDEIGKLKSS